MLPIRLPIITFLLLGLFPFSITSQTDGDALFDTSFVHEIRFSSPNPNLLGELVQIWNSSPFGEPPYVPAGVQVDGVAMDSIGVRIKGNLSSFNAKKPLKIDFNQYRPEQQYDGIKKINLLNADLDPAFQRDMLGYLLFRLAGVKASRVAYARVYFNNMFNGLYIMVEQVDRGFLQDRFSTDDGVLYKNKTCNLEVESGENTLEHYQNMMQAASLNGTAFRNAIEQVLDTDAFLRFFLIEHFIDARDNPLDVGCNFYLYHEPKTGLNTWIPWDLNYAFFGGNNFALTYPGENIVFQKMMLTPHYRARYLNLACEMMEYLFTNERIHPLIDQAANLARPALVGDPHFTNLALFETDVATLKNFISTRRSEFLSDLASEPYTCPALTPVVASQAVSINEIVTSSDSTSSISDPAGGFPDWIELYNNSSDTIHLDDYYLSHDRDFLKQWPFPTGTRINPGSYLIVWADRDLDEPGLHTNFKLDKAGGELILSHENFSLIDTMTYGPQTTNVAYARVPNGTGPFVHQAATFAQANAVMSHQTQPDMQDWSVFPNPVTNTLVIKTNRALTADVILFDLFSNRVAFTPLTNGFTELNISALPPGVYQVVLQGTGRVEGKLVVKVN
ncbi:MAG: CotH kinase family protein [Saprospiraceae bacterium]|nr:CotH kinase family protein [Saprospiraceae bacterium]